MHTLGRNITPIVFGVGLQFVFYPIEEAISLQNWLYEPNLQSKFITNGPVEHWPSPKDFTIVCERLIKFRGATVPYTSQDTCSLDRIVTL